MPIPLGDYFKILLRNLNTISILKLHKTHNGSY